MTDMLYTPKSEIDARIAIFQQALEQLGIDGALIIHHTNLFYLSGTSQSSHLFIPRTGQPILMVRKSFARARQESPLGTILEVKSLKAIPDLLKERGFSIETLGLELDVIPYNTWQFYNKVFKDTTFSDISDVLRRIRTIKSDYEIDLLHRACGVLDQVFAEVPSWLREGMTEIELASLFEAGMRRRGYGGCSKMRAFNQDFFMGNVTSGASGAAPTYFDGPVGGCGLTPANNPHGAGWKTIGQNEVVYIDYTCVIDGYTADGARMFVLGDVSERLRRAHAAALAIQAELVTMIKPGVLCEAVYAKSAELAESMGLADHFMGIGNDRVRFIGHGVGLELDEYPIFATGVKMPLAAGMTFALEPKFVFPEGAIGTENTYALRADGPQVLTHVSEDIIRV
jgi:Xaa-Pro aminopeptidase